MADKQEKILDIKVNYSKAIKAIAEYQTKIDAAREAESKLKKQLNEGEISRQQYNEEMAASKAYIADCNDSIRIITKTMQNQIKQEKEQEGSLKSLRAQLSNLTAEYDAMSEMQRKSSEGKKMQKDIKELTDVIKEAEEETQRYYRNVGNYKDAIIEASNANVPFVSQINQMITSVGGLRKYFSNLHNEVKDILETYKADIALTEELTGAQKAAAIATANSTKVLKLLRIALISTGIGALVVALGTLIAYFSKTQKGIELANKLMGALGATVNVLIDRAAKLGSALVNLFSGNFKKAGEDAKAVFSGIGKEIVEETKLAWDLADILNEIDKREVMLSMSRAANRAEIEKLKKAADDQTLSTQERIKAAERAAEIEKKDLDVQTQLAEARLANTLGFKEMNGEVRKLMEQIKAGDVTADEVIGKLGLSESTLEDLKDFRDQFNELQELMEDSYSRQTEQQNTLNSIRQEGVDKAKEAKQTELEAVRAAEDAMLALVKDKREQARKEIELNYSRQIEDLQISLKEEENLTAKARQAINTQIKALEEQKNLELQKLSDEELQKEVENRTKLISLQLESVREGSEQEYQLRMQLIASQRDAELADKELTEQMKLAITDKYNKQMDDLVAQREQDISQKQQESIRLRMENEIMQLQQSGASELEILQEQAAQKFEFLSGIQQQEGESEQEFLNRKLQANQEYLDAKKAIADKEVEIEQTKFEAISSITSGLSSAFEALGESNKSFAILGKAIALAEIAVNTGKAIAAGVAQAQSVPFPANIAAIATTVGTILTNIATAINTVKSAKFATGGLVTGPGTGTSDSVPAQLSNGESVMTARATSMFAPILSSFNQMGGGVPINVAQSSNQSIGEDMLARAVAKGMLMAPAPQVSVEEFTSVANKVKFLESNGNL